MVMEPTQDLWLFAFNMMDQALWLINGKLLISNSVKSFKLIKLCIAIHSRQLLKQLKDTFCINNCIVITET